MMEVAVQSKQSAALEEETVTRTVNVFLALFVEETTANSSIQQLQSWQIAAQQKHLHLPQVRLILFEPAIVLLTLCPVFLLFLEPKK